MERLIKRFRAGLDEAGIGDMSAIGRIIVAFSGGADSTLLLHLAVRYFENTNVVVEAAHLNHMIRGDEADRDERFCVKTAEELCLKLHLKRVDVPALVAGGKGGVEEVARSERYTFFDELIAADTRKTLVATAHNADDNLETVLFNLARGTSLRGLCGIPPLRDGRYVRPLLGFTGDEIRRACAELGFSYVNDSTNFETEYTRNYIRAEVVPALAKLAPQLHSHTSKMSALLRRDEDFLSSQAEEFLENEGIHAGIENVRLVDLHDAVLSRVIPRLHESATAGKAPSLESVHINAVITALRGKREPFSISLPGGFSFTSDGRLSKIETSSRPEITVDREETELSLDRVITKNGYNILFTRDFDEIKRIKEENIYNLSIYKAFNFDKINGSLKIRTRVSGDTLRYGGMTRKVKKLFSEKHLSPEEREALPLILDGEGIVWIPTFPARDGLVPEKQSPVVYCCVFK